jgi:pilus assembly protein Flp/PilA
MRPAKEPINHGPDSLQIGAAKPSNLTSVQEWQARLSSRSERVTGEQAMNSLVQRFLKDESGATAVEYGLIAAGISLAIITVAHSLATQLKSTFTHMPDELAKTSTGGGS